MRTTHVLQKTHASNAVFDKLAQDDHEQVVYCYDKATGLKAIIAMHSTALGPALGGVRIWDYAHDGEALTDVLRLSKGMTYKAALLRLKLGGGQSSDHRGRKPDQDCSPAQKVWPVCRRAAW